MLQGDHEWRLPPLTCELSSGAVHVWIADLIHVAPSYTLQESILSAEERERAARFRFERERWWYVATHVVLRLLLSQYVGQAPECLTFRTGRYGKPALVLDADQLSRTLPLQFNLSHSHGMVVYAIARGREVGVDIERIEESLDWERIAARVLSKREQEALQSLPERDRDRAFYTCWTRKEALVKAAGYGLQMPLDSFDVSLGPSEPARLFDVRTTPDMPMEAACWCLRELPPIPGYSATLAIEGHNRALACWRWNEEQIWRVRS